MLFLRKKHIYLQYTIYRVIGSLLVVDIKLLDNRRLEIYILILYCCLETDIVLLDCCCLEIDIIFLDRCHLEIDIVLLLRWNRLDIASLDCCRLEIEAVTVPSTNVNYTILRFPTSEGRYGVVAGLWKWETYDPTNFEKET